MLSIKFLPHFRVEFLLLHHGHEQLLAEGRLLNQLPPDVEVPAAELRQGRVRDNLLNLGDLGVDVIPERSQGDVGRSRQDTWKQTS